MKVITEERLRELIKNHERMISDVAQIKYRLLEDLLDYECKEIDTLTVSKLRPMSDAPVGVGILVDHDFALALTESKRDVCENKIITSCGIKIGFSECNGWIPKPIYKPEVTGE